MYVYARSQSQIYFILWDTVEKNLENQCTSWIDSSSGVRESFFEEMLFQQSSEELTSGKRQRGA